MEGDWKSPELRGVIPNAFQHIFDHVALADATTKYLVKASYYEIYNEEIRDLLSNSKTALELKEASGATVMVKGLTIRRVTSANEIDQVMRDGKKNRSVGSTNMNQVSSRSHAIFTIVVECSRLEASGERVRMGKLNLVDLAGSERQSKTGATGDRLKEATKINWSLSALGNVISALVDKASQHIPYRDSKLTRILQDSLGGNTKTLMVANVGPATYNYQESLATLRYASRAKKVRNKPVINDDPKDAELRHYQDEISRLRAELSRVSGGVEQIAQETTPSSDVVCVKGEEIAGSRQCVEEEQDRLKKLNTGAENERTTLASLLEEERLMRERSDDQRRQLEQRIKDMEARLIVGGEMASKAARQEASLRKAEQDLVAKREREVSLAREMSEKEEANLELEAKFASKNDEAQAKARKVRKLARKVQQLRTEISDTESEFRREKCDLLDTIRDLTKQLKLKNLIVEYFIPMKVSAQTFKKFVPT